MGAKMMPMEKNRGSTVFGVRMGLIAHGQQSVANVAGLAPTSCR